MKKEPDPARELYKIQTEVIKFIKEIQENRRNKMQNRWKSPVLYTSLIAALALILKAFGVVVIDDVTLSTVTSVVLGLLVAIGVVNNPESSTSL